MNKIRNNNVTWQLISPNTELPKEILSDPYKYACKCGKTVVKSKKGSSFLLGEHFLKVYNLSLMEIIKNIFRENRAQREFHGALRLWKMGIPTPEPLALGREKALLPRKYFYILRTLKNGVSLSQITLDNQIMVNAARIIKRMHDAGIYHKDLHSGNLILKNDTVYITDLHRHRLFKNQVPMTFRLKDIARFLVSLKKLQQPLMDTFLREYFGEATPEELSQAQKEEALRRLKHIKEDCLKSSLEFQKTKRAQFRIYTRKGISVEEALKIVKKHQEVVLSKSSQLVKQSRKTAVSLFPFKDTRVCVKEYRFTCLSGLKQLLCMPKPRRAWRNANLLYALGIGAMKPLALLEKWKGFLLERAFLIVESPPEYVELPTMLLRLSSCPHEIKQLRKELCSFLLHLQSLIIPVWHRDLKAHHLFVKKIQDKWDFAIIESEDVIFVKTKYSQMLRALVQLNTSIPTSVSVKERMRVLKSLLPSRQIASEARKIVNLSKRRGYIY